MIPAQMTDIPVHRTVERAVTGMGLAMGRHIALLDRPYVWGASDPSIRPSVGMDFEPSIEKPTRPVPKPRVLTAKEQRLLAENYRRVEQQKAERRRKREQAEEERREQQRKWLADYRALGVRPADPLPRLPEPEPERPPAPARHIRPAPDWKPLTGADIDALLDDVDRKGLRRGARGGAA